MWGSSVAHFGFGVMLLGILISNAKQHIISQNTLGIDYGENFDDEYKRNNILLYKNDTTRMADYDVIYQGDSIRGFTTFYKVKYEKRNPETGKLEEQFTLYPLSLIHI